MAKVSYPKIKWPSIIALIVIAGVILYSLFVGIPNHMDQNEKDAMEGRVPSGSVGDISGNDDLVGPPQQVEE